jgi:hypothetical protein
LDLSPTAAQVTYPLPIARLVQQHGEEQVAQACLDHLGYPIAWVDGDDRKEVLAVLKAVATTKGKV